MATVIVRKIRVRDLPRELRTGLDAAPEDVVEVTVDAGRRRKVAELLALVQEIGAEAERRGLTGEKLNELLALQQVRGQGTSGAYQGTAPS